MYRIQRHCVNSSVLYILYARITSLSLLIGCCSLFGNLFEWIVMNQISYITIFTSTYECMYMYSVYISPLFWSIRSPNSFVLVRFVCERFSILFSFSLFLILRTSCSCYLKLTAYTISNTKSIHICIKYSRQCTNTCTWTHVHVVCVKLPCVLRSHNCIYNVLHWICVHVLYFCHI